MTSSYDLEIYEPGSTYDLWTSFKSASPFMGFSVGDIINPGPWLESMHPEKVVRIVGIEHMIFTSKEKVNHKLCIFTEEIDNTPEARVGK